MACTMLTILGSMYLLAAREAPSLAIEAVQVTSSADGNDAVPLTVALPFFRPNAAH